MYRKVFTIIVLLLPIGCANQNVSSKSEEDYAPTCGDQINYAYDLYQKAIRSAQSGNCDMAVSQFKESKMEWEYLLISEKCTPDQKEYVQSNVHRINYDIEILKRKFCKTATL